MSIVYFLRIGSAAEGHFCCIKSVAVCGAIRYNKTWFILSVPRVVFPGRIRAGQVQKLEKKVSAVLVAAGSSTRMGFDKLSFDLGGETVVQRRASSGDSRMSFCRIPALYESFRQVRNLSPDVPAG